MTWSLFCLLSFYTEIVIVQEGYVEYLNSICYLCSIFRTYRQKVLNTLFYYFSILYYIFHFCCLVCIYTTSGHRNCAKNISALLSGLIRTCHVLFICPYSDVNSLLNCYSNLTWIFSKSGIYYYSNIYSHYTVYHFHFIN